MINIPLLKRAEIILIALVINSIASFLAGLVIGTIIGNGLANLAAVATGACVTSYIVIMSVVGYRIVRWWLVATKTENPPKSETEVE